MFGATTLSTALVIDKYLQRCDAAAVRRYFESFWSRIFGLFLRPAPICSAPVYHRELSVRASAFSVLCAGRPIQGRLCFGRAGPFLVRHICNTSRESKLKRKKSNENSSFRHAFELTEASTRNTS
jgi:hypothetical protein